MSLPEERNSEVVAMVDYLQDTIAEIDGAVNGWVGRRHELAVRLAAMRASYDPKVLEAAADFEERLETSRPYENAEDAVALLSEAHRRYGM